MKVGDLVLLKEEWRTLDIYYGPGVITMVDEGSGVGSSGIRWKSFRVQWNDDFLWHDPDELELVSEDS